MTDRPKRFRVTPIYGGKWSGGGRATLNNVRFAATRYPDFFSETDGSGIPLILRNVAPSKQLGKGAYLLMPQNAWPWSGPWGEPKEAIRRMALKAGSEVSIRRSKGVLRISSAIRVGNGNASPVLHNVLDPEFEVSLDACRSRPALSESIVCIGGLSTYRNLMRTIQAFNLYRSAGGRLDLHIVGPPSSPEHIANLETFVEATPGASIKAKLLSRSEILSTLQSCYLAIFPSLTEASPVTVLEALVVAKRVTLSRIQGHVEIVQGGLPKDWFFEPGDIREIATVMKRSEELTSNVIPSDLSEVQGRAAIRETWARNFVGYIDELLDNQ